MFLRVGGTMQKDLVSRGSSVGPDIIFRSAAQTEGETAHHGEEHAMRSVRITLVTAAGLATFALAACTPGVVFVAPEIDPPTDLIPEYVPKGFELVSGFQIQPREARFDPKEDSEGQRCVFPVGGKIDPGIVQSPSGNTVQGVQYRNGETILLITKSEFPGGSLDLWREAVEGGGLDGEESCGCATEASFPRIGPPRAVEILQEHLVKGVRVAVVNWLERRMLVFVRGDNFIAVQGGISLEEALKIIESLLP
jgi:hypothetical protein